MQQVNALTPEQMAATANYGKVPPLSDSGPIIINDHDSPIGSSSDDLAKPNILISGPSGSGKSTSLRNLDPATTIILSTEMKALPFRGARRFKMHVPIKSFAHFKSVFSKALMSNKARVIVLDSYTSLAEFAYNEIVRPVRNRGVKNDTWEAWAQYKEQLHDILIQSKTSDKYVVILGVDGNMDEPEEQYTKCTDVQGSLKGKIEKEFTCVVWTRVIEPELATNAKKQYVFVTQSEHGNKAKTPFGMFEHDYIPNDLAEMISQIENFYDDEQDPAFDQYANSAPQNAQPTRSTTSEMPV